jgi:hypothetical protein
MKTRIAIGDIHGRPYWKQYLDLDFTQFYILGDYFDSHNYMPFKTQYDNFIDIAETATKDNRIKLCLGNHDFHYLIQDPNEQYSQYQEENAYAIHEILLKYKNVIQIVYTTQDHFLISHAGVSSSFMKQNGFSTPNEINELFHSSNDNTSLEFLRFNGYDYYGDDVTQGPLWIRPHSLSTDALPGYSQIIGHTVFKEIKTVSLPQDDINQTNRTLSFIDTKNGNRIFKF